MSDCIHGLGPASACTICNGRDAREAVPVLPEPRAYLKARYAGQCPACDLPIVVGQRVAWHPDYLARHDHCWETT